MTVPRKPADFDIVPKLDSLRDMEPIKLGELNGLQHMGLHIRIAHPVNIYGRITEINHVYLGTQVRVRWNGQSQDFRSDPELMVRIEATT